MSLDKDLINKLVNVTSNAAIKCYNFVGKEDKIAADRAATDSMRNDLNNLNINGEVVIGEGELDEAPMLYIGEKLGKGNGPHIDIAVDPLDGTNNAAKNLPGAISVLAISEKGNLLNAPETYMDKLAVGKDVPYDATDFVAASKLCSDGTATLSNIMPPSSSVSSGASNSTSFSINSTVSSSSCGPSFSSSIITS